MSLSPKTLFVVGAGASYEVGLPIGSGLKECIVNALSYKPREGSISDEIIGRALDIANNRNRSLYIQACQHICEAMPQVISIDNFIDQHRGNEQIERCGKLAIVRAILAAESGSSLFINPLNVHNKMEFGNKHSNSLLKPLEETWFNSFWKLLTENCTVEDLEERFSKVAFIIFNYDRCIEHFLYNSLLRIYRIGEKKAAELVKSIEIYHPYGTVGSLRWQSEVNTIGYGEEANHGQLLELAKQIKTFTEGANSSDMLSIRSLMMSSPRIIFLGFAFHERNMELLLSKSPAKPTAKYIYGTAFGVSDDSTDSICTDLVATYKQVSPVLRNEHTCYGLFHDLERRLSFV